MSGFTHVEKSDHTTIWLARHRAVDAIETALPQLQARLHVTIAHVPRRVEHRLTVGNVQ
jgi:hypothetical protein